MVLERQNVAAKEPKLTLYLLPNSDHPVTSPWASETHC